MNAVDINTAAEAAARALFESGRTLAAAESLTGGMVCCALVGVPGMSKHLLEGVVTYTNPAKVRLGVAQKTLDERTAVSAECALEMAESARKRAGADIGVSTTGVAGPGCDGDGNPEGLVYVGVSAGGKGYAVKAVFFGTRLEIRMSACLLALGELKKAAMA